MTLWFIVYALVVPMSAFSASPSSKRLWRIWRNKTSFLIGYFITFLLLYYYVSHDGSYSRFSVHWMFLGWFWTFLYVGFWEGCWRLFYRRLWKKHNGVEVSFWRGMCDDWFSTMLVWISVFQIAFFIALIVAAYIYELFFRY